MDAPTERLCLHVPETEELWFRQEMMADPATMSYNAPWSPPDGCIAFPPPEWKTYRGKWVGRQPERWYAYLRRRSDDAFVGEVNTHRAPEGDRWNMGVLIHARYRGLGYGAEGLHLLLEHAFLTDGVPCLQNEFEIVRAAAYRIHCAAGFREDGVRDGIVRLLLTREEYLKR